MIKKKCYMGVRGAKGEEKKYKKSPNRKK